MFCFNLGILMSIPVNINWIRSIGKGRGRTNVCFVSINFF
jgi:hypothetical protein